jgi:hypothetical protein
VMGRFFINVVIEEILLNEYIFVSLNECRLAQLTECLLHLDMSSNGLLQLNPQVGQLKELRFLDLRYKLRLYIFSL